jgi:hypothetical protein
MTWCDIRNETLSTSIFKISWTVTLIKKRNTDISASVQSLVFEWHENQKWNKLNRLLPANSHSALLQDDLVYSTVFFSFELHTNFAYIVNKIQHNIRIILRSIRRIIVSVLIVITEQNDSWLYLDMLKKSNNNVVIRTVCLYHIGTAELHDFLENFLKMFQYHIDIWLHDHTLSKKMLF